MLKQNTFVIIIIIIIATLAGRHTSNLSSELPWSDVSSTHQKEDSSGYTRTISAEEPAEEPAEELPFLLFHRPWTNHQQTTSTSNKLAASLASQKQELQLTGSTIPFFFFLLN